MKMMCDRVEAERMARRARRRTRQLAVDSVALAMLASSAGAGPFVTQYRDTINDSTAGLFSAVLPTSDGGAIVGASISLVPQNFEGNDPTLVKVDSTGSVAWAKTYWLGWGSATFRRVAPAPGGGYVALLVDPELYNVGGGFGHSGDWAFVKVDADGEMLWSRFWRSAVPAGFEYASVSDQDMAAVSDQGYVVVGMVRTTALGRPEHRELLVTRLALDGAVLWQKSYYYSDPLSAFESGHELDVHGFAVMADGGVVVGLRGGDDCPMACRLDPAGNILWQRRYRAPSISSNNGALAIDAVARTADGTLVMAGAQQGPGGLFVMATDADGLPTRASVVREPGDPSSHVRVESIVQLPLGRHAVAGGSFEDNGLPAYWRSHLMVLDPSLQVASSRVLMDDADPSNDSVLSDIALAADGSQWLTGRPDRTGGGVATELLHLDSAGGAGGGCALFVDQPDSSLDVTSAVIAESVTLVPSDLGMDVPLYGPVPSQQRTRTWSLNRDVLCQAADPSATHGPGDLTPRGALDGIVTVGDAVLALRFSVALDVPTAQELTNGDVAPSQVISASAMPRTIRATGDGVIGAGDVVALLRVSVGLDTFVP